MLGVKEFIKVFTDEKDWDEIAKKRAKKEGVSIEEIKSEWENKRIRGENLHSLIQKRSESEANVESFTYKSGDSENLPEQDSKLENGKIYLERPCFSKKQGLMGIPDRIDVIKNTIHIEDIKTWEVLNRTSPVVKTSTGFMKYKMQDPISHLDECNFIEATVQLSLYMNILLENNRNLKAGKLTIRHVITNRNDEIIKEDIHEVPYLREEVQAMLKYKKQNRI